MFNSRVRYIWVTLISVLSIPRYSYTLQ